MNEPDLPAAVPEQHRGWFFTVGWALDVLANAILDGRKGDTISARCGRSIALGGWAARVPWPRWWVDHCYWAAGLPRLV